MYCLAQMTFRLRAGARPMEFRDALHQLRPWFQAQPGFEYCVVTADAECLSHLVVWTGEACAQSAQQSFESSAEAQMLMRHIDPGTLRIDHFRVFQSFGPQMLDAA